MKRANSFSRISTLLITGILSSTAFSQGKESQTCADAAFELTGDTRYELLDSTQLVTGKDWYKLKLESAQSGTEITCKIRRGRITALQIDIPEMSEETTTTS